MSWFNDSPSVAVDPHVYVLAPVSTVLVVPFEFFWSPACRCELMEGLCLSRGRQTENTSEALKEPNG